MKSIFIHLNLIEDNRNKNEKRKKRNHSDRAWISQSTLLLIKSSYVFYKQIEIKSKGVRARERERKRVVCTMLPYRCLFIWVTSSLKIKDDTNNRNASRVSIDWTYLRVPYHRWYPFHWMLLIVHRMFDDLMI